MGLKACNLTRYRIAGGSRRIGGISIVSGIPLGLAWPAYFSIPNVISMTAGKYSQSLSICINIITTNLDMDYIWR